MKNKNLSCLKENQDNKNCHPGSLLAGVSRLPGRLMKKRKTSLLDEQQKREIPDQVRDDIIFCMNTSRGFTLIELLVVVLIIGILAAVALPQYNKAVEKSRITEAITVLNSLKKAYQLCVLEHGKPSGDDSASHPCGSHNFFSNIDIEIPGTDASDNCDAPGCIYTKDWQYDTDTYYLSAYRITNGDVNSTPPYQIQVELPNGEFVCQDIEVAGSCQKICGNDQCVLK